MPLESHSQWGTGMEQGLGQSLSIYDPFPESGCFHDSHLSAHLDEIGSDILNVLGDPDRTGFAVHFGSAEAESSAVEGSCSGDTVVNTHKHPDAHGTEAAELANLALGYRVTRNEGNLDVTL